MAQAQQAVQTVGGSWQPFGDSFPEALQTNDGDTSYAQNPLSSNNLTASATVSVPAGAAITHKWAIITAKGSGTLTITGDVSGSISLSGAYSSGYPNTAVSKTSSGSESVSITIDPSDSGCRITEIVFAVDYTLPNSPPSAPTSLSPANGATVSTLLPTFGGTHVDVDGDAMSNVDLEVRRVSDDTLMWSAQKANTGASFSQQYAGTTLVSGTQYKWRARTKSGTGSTSYGTWSSYLTFTPVINAAPSVTATSPIGGAVVGTATPTLAWSFSDPDGDAQARYQVQVRRVSDGASMWDSGQVASSAKSATYAGTALASGVSYEWRVRVQDAPGAWSDYTSYASFSYSAVPNAPTSLVPSGLQSTLTPTISATYQQGTGAAEAGYYYELRQGAVVIYQSGLVSGAIGTGQAYGTNNPSDTPSSPPALTWGSSYEIRAKSRDANGAESEWSAWQSFSTNAAPTTPTNLSPNGAVTGDTTPTLSWTHNDPDGDAQTEVEVELRKVSDDSVVTGYGPKVLAQATGTHDVTQTLTASPATQYKWRVRTKATAGPGYGPWSEWVTFTVANAPTVTVSSPTPSQVVGSPALSVQWAMSGGSGTQQSYRVRVFADDQTTQVHDSGSQAGTGTSYALPSGVLRNNTSYYVQVEAVDTLAQSAQSTKVAISTSWTPPATITGLSAVALGDQS